MKLPVLQLVTVASQSCIQGIPISFSLSIRCFTVIWVMTSFLWVKFARRKGKDSGCEIWASRGCWFEQKWEEKS